MKVLQGNFGGSASEEEKEEDSVKCQGCLPTTIFIGANRGSSTSAGCTLHILYGSGSVSVLNANLIVIVGTIVSQLRG